MCWQRRHGGSEIIWTGSEHSREPISISDFRTEGTGENPTIPGTLNCIGEKENVVTTLSILSFMT